MKLRGVRKNYKKWKNKALALQKWILKNFEEELVYKKFVDLIDDGKEPVDLKSWFDELEAEVVEHA